ncbi:MAG: hypothetical protein JW940_04045 [Polyangiaceae bacterium]|nr:hypothetical protein [Polyangiaceae bacterium]
MSQFARLDGQHIVETSARLCARITERFPGSSLAGVAANLVELAKSSCDLAERLAAPHWPIRTVCGTGLMVLAAALVGAALNLRLPAGEATLFDWVQALESGVNDVVFIGIAAWFLLSMEERVKRARVLGWLHGLRAIAHIVDMHQLPKHPESVASQREHRTESSPERTMEGFELMRYLDYCSELLAVASNLGALVVQDFPDPTVLARVNDLETLTSELAQKLWQKIDIVDRVMRERAVRPCL